MASIPWYFVTCSIGGSSGGNVTIRIDGNHSDSVMIFAIKFVAIDATVHTIRIGRFVRAAESRWIWFNILKNREIFL